MVFKDFFKNHDEYWIEANGFGRGEATKCFSHIVMKRNVIAASVSAGTNNRTIVKGEYYGYWY
jgi:hypothetical protein